MISLFKQNTDKNNKIGIVIRNSEQITTPLALSFRLVSQLDSEVLWSLIYRAAQSNAEFLLEGNLTATVHIVDPPIGHGPSECYRRVFTSAQDFVNNNKSIIKIKNKDSLCLPVAVVQGMSLIDNTPNPRKLQEDENRVDELVENLMNETGLSFENGGGYHELDIIQDCLPQHTQLIVFDNFRTHHIFYKRDIFEPTSFIYLFLHDGHYDVIASITGFTISNYFCTSCYRAYSNRLTHRCKEKCPACRLSPVCMKQSAKIVCKDCGREFYSRKCYQQHKQHKLTAKLSVCDYYKKCRNCNTTYVMYKKRTTPHICGEIFCTNCRCHKARGHLCYITPDKKSEPPSTKKILYCYFDIESTIDTQISSDVNDGTIHQCNLLVAHTQCDACEQIEDISIFCSQCGIRKHVFWENSVEEFIKFLSQPRKQFSQTYIFSHNFSGIIKF
jgi:hypothetical protein